MAYSEDVFKSYNHLANNLNKIGEVSYKSLFFGLGIKINGHIVGMITHSNEVIIQSTPDTIDSINTLELKMYTNNIQKVSNYFFLSMEILDKKDFIFELFEQTYQGVLKLVEKKKQDNQDQLKNMPNIKTSLAKKLKDVGIETPNKLRKVTAPVAFALIRYKFGDTLSDSILFKLEAAIKGVHEATLKPEEKTKLRSRYEREVEKQNHNQSSNQPTSKP